MLGLYRRLCPGGDGQEIGATALGASVLGAGTASALGRCCAASSRCRCAFICFAFSHTPRLSRRSWLHVSAQASGLYMPSAIAVLAIERCTVRRPTPSSLASALTLSPARRL